MRYTTVDTSFPLLAPLIEYPLYVPEVTSILVPPRITVTGVGTGTGGRVGPAGVEYGAEELADAEGVGLLMMLVEKVVAENVLELVESEDALEAVDSEDVLDELASEDVLALVTSDDVLEALISREVLDELESEVAGEGDVSGDVLVAASLPLEDEAPVAVDPDSVVVDPAVLVTTSEELEAASARALIVAKVVPRATDLLSLLMKLYSVQTEPSNAVPTQALFWAQAFRQSSITTAVRFFETDRMVPSYSVFTSIPKVAPPTDGVEPSA